MVEVGFVRAVNLVLSLLVLSGLVYLVFTGIRRFGYDWHPLLLLASAVLLVAEAGARLFLPPNTHLVHAAAAFVVVLALYDPRRNRLRWEEWVDLLLADRSFGTLPDYYADPEETALGVLATRDIALTPALIADNSDRAETEIGAELERLVAHRLVERVDGNKYRLTSLGRRYVERRTVPSQKPDSPLRTPT